MQKKSIPSKNYIVLIGIVLLVICACFAFYNLYNIYQENKISVSPLAEREVFYEDLSSTTEELDADTFLVISYVQNRDIYDNEKAIKKYLNKNNLLNNVLYLNVTDRMIEETFVDDLNNLLNLTDSLKIENFPAVVYYKDNEVTYTIDSSDHLLNQGDFEQIVDMYELAS